MKVFKFCLSAQQHGLMVPHKVFFKAGTVVLWLKYKFKLPSTFSGVIFSKIICTSTGQVQDLCTAVFSTWSSTSYTNSKVSVRSEVTDNINTSDNILTFCLQIQSKTKIQSSVCVFICSSVREGVKRLVLVQVWTSPGSDGGSQTAGGFMLSTG